MTSSPGRIDALVIIIVLLAAGMALAMFVADCRHSEFLWRGDPSDRNIHFDQGLRLAIALRQLDVRSFLHELGTARLYPPLHGLLLAPLLLVSDLDFRVGVVPSLVGWVVTVVVTAMIARQFFSNRIEGVVAAGTAAIFAMACPTMQFLANDVMLECWGSALTALVIYFYMQAYRLPESVMHWRALALALTCLFFEKYNYFVLVALALGLTFLALHRDTWLGYVRLAWRDRRAILAAIGRDPALLISALLFCLVLFIAWRGIREINLLGLKVGVYPPNNLLTVAYVILWCRLALAWFKHRKVLDSAIGVGGRTLLLWFVAPVTISFLFPQRLPWFLFAVGPTNSVSEPEGPFSGLVDYGVAFTRGFVVGPWAAVAAALLTMVAFVQRRRFPVECNVVFILIATCGALVILHPNHQPRFIASWIFAIWVCTGAGAGILFRALARLANRSWQKTAMAAVAMVALAAATATSKPSLDVAAAYAHQTPGPSDFDLLPDLLAALASQPRSPIIGLLPGEVGVRWVFLRWNAEVQCRCLLNSESPRDLPGADHDQVIGRVSTWADQTGANVIIGYFEQGSAIREDWLMTAMEAQTRFRLVATHPFPGQTMKIVIWQRQGAR